jgi:hypothetical protein
MHNVSGQEAKEREMEATVEEKKRGRPPKKSEMVVVLSPNPKDELILSEGEEHLVTERGGVIRPKVKPGSQAIVKFDWCLGLVPRKFWDELRSGKRGPSVQSRFTHNYWEWEEWWDGYQKRTQEAMAFWNWMRQKIRLSYKKHKSPHEMILDNLRKKAEELQAIARES